MKLHIVSDLHVDYNKLLLSDIPYQEADVLVLAGDVAEGISAITVVNALSKRYPRVIYVPGNHEYWHQDKHKYQNMLIEGTKANVSVLLNGSITLFEGKRSINFIGGTMYSNFKERVLHPLNVFDIERGIPDFKYTTVNNQVLTADLHNAMYYEFIYMLEEELLKSTCDKNIVVSHFAPSERSINPRYKNNPLTPYFVNALPDQTFDGIDLWIHGHTHNSFDYNINECRVICNPYGYRKAGEGKGFKEDLIIDI